MPAVTRTKTTSKKKPAPKKKPGGTKTTRRKPLPDIAQRIQDAELDDYINILLYGKSKTGKTTLWSTFPGPIIVVLCSAGNEAGELRSLSKAVRKNIKTIILDDPKDIPELVQYIEDEDYFKTMVLDHVSGLQDKVLAQILEMEKVPEQKHWGLATQQEYGQCTQQLKEYLRKFISTKRNSVVIAQERVFEITEEMKASSLILPWVGAGLTPAMSGWINTACDYICQTFKRPEVKKVTRKVAGKNRTTEEETGKLEYCLRTGPHEVFTTGFRSPIDQVVPDVIVNPTYKKLEEYFDN